MKTNLRNEQHDTYSTVVLFARKMKPGRRCSKLVNDDFAAKIVLPPSLKPSKNSIETANKNHSPI